MKVDILIVLLLTQGAAGCHLLLSVGKGGDAAAGDRPAIAERTNPEGVLDTAGDRSRPLDVTPAPDRGRPPVEWLPSGKCTGGTALGGGADCSPGLVISMGLGAGDAYEVTCSEGQGTAWVACLSRALVLYHASLQLCTMGAAVCPVGKAAVGGSCTAAAAPGWGEIISALPSLSGSPVCGPSWSCWFAGAGSGAAYCAPEDAFGKPLAYRQPPTCLSSEYLIGGGCGCTGRIQYSRPNGQSWECGCSEGPAAAAYAICAAWP